MCSLDQTPLQNGECRVASRTTVRNKQRGSVNFDGVVKVTTIPHINDFSQDDIDVLWYTREEFGRSKAACMRIVRRMNKAEDMPPCQDCTSVFPIERAAASTRGLESLANSKANIRRIRRLAAAKAVLSEQSFQRDEGYRDPEFLSQIYRHISAPCQVEANLTGLQDEKEATRCYHLPVETPQATGLATALKLVATRCNSSVSRGT